MASTSHITQTSADQPRADSQPLLTEPSSTTEAPVPQWLPKSKMTWPPLHPRILRAKEKQHLIAVKTEFHDGESSRPIKQEVVESEPTRAIKKQVLHGETPAEASGSSNALDDDDDEPPGRVTGSGPSLQARGEVQTVADSPTLGPHRPLSGQDQQAIMALRWYTQWALEGLLCAFHDRNGGTTDVRKAQIARAWSVHG